MMQEMLSRRLEHSMKREADSKQNMQNSTNLKTKRYPLPASKDWPLPDLIVIDGGKGQLSAAMEVLEKFEVSGFMLHVVGLAKRIEEIFLPGQSVPITLSHDHPSLQLLQRLRDEAHRFGITFHRDLRSKQAIRSALDSIPGVGPKTKKLLKAKFGSVAEIKKADLPALAAVVGEKLAKTIKQNI
jgi:excinuclease ABC subunit C